MRMAEAPKAQRNRRVRRRNTNNEAVEVNVEVNESNHPPQQNNQARPRRRRRQQRRRQRRPVFGPWLPGQRPRTRLRRAIKREIKKEGLDGPRVSVQQRVSSTFGLVGPNKSGNVELELNFFLHPSLAKEANDGTSFGPVQALAAQYALWKLKYLRLTFTPMVGASAVSGTVIRASLNLSQSPGGTNWSGLGTRVHLDMHPGQTAVFHLRGDQIGGPRDGGWWMTDTNEEGSQSAGPIIEVHTLGKTESTFKAVPWDSPLFIVEGLGVWQFANYQVKPALGMLERRQAEVPVTIEATPGEPITMEMPLNNAVTTFMLDAEPESFAVSSTNSVGETIFQIVDVGADLASQFSPPPFSWLISGGWWFLKRVFGKSKATTASFNIYPSLADAQNDRPAIAGPTASITAANPVNAELIVTQINAPNVGPQPTAVAQVRASVPVPMHFGMFRLHSSMYPMETIAWQGTSGDAYPTSYIIGKLHQINSSGKYYVKTSWYITQSSRGDTATTFPPSNQGTYIHTVYKLQNPRFTDLTGNIEYIPPEPKSGASLYHGSGKSEAQTVYHRVGDVVATAAIQPGNTNYLGMVLTLIKVVTPEPAGYETPDMDFIRSNQGGTSAVQRSMVMFQKVSEDNSNAIRKIEIRPGDYLLGISFGAETAGSATTPPIVKLAQTNVDIAVSLPFNKNNTSYATDAFFRLDALQNLPHEPVSIPYGLSGSMFATFSTDLNLNYISGLDQKLLEQLIALGFKPAADEQPPSDFKPDSDTDDSSSEDDIKEYLQLLLELGRLPTRAEIAYRDADYDLAYQIYKDQ